MEPGEAACRNWSLGLGGVHLFILSGLEGNDDLYLFHTHCAHHSPNSIPVTTGSSSSHLLSQRETPNTTLANGQEPCIYIYILYNIWVDTFDFSLANLCAKKMRVKTFTKGVVSFIYLASFPFCSRAWSFFILRRFTGQRENQKKKKERRETLYRYRELKWELFIVRSRKVSLY